MAAMNPAMIMSMMAMMGPLLKSFAGDEGGFGSTYNENQLGMLDQILNSLKGGAPNVQDNQNYLQGQDWLNSLFNDPEFFKNMEAPLQRQFEENTVPELANRFAGMGAGATGSTAFRNQLGREGSNLHSNIAAMRTGMQQQGVNQSLQYAQQPFNNYMQQLMAALQPTQNVYQPSSY